MTEQLDDDFEEQSDEWPYCECGNQADEEEEAFNACKSCGKPLE